MERMANLKANLDVLQQKAKERTVKTQNIEYDLDTIVRKISNGVIKLDPDYQRRHRWDEGTSSRLIESLILNIPIPYIYLSQDIDVDAEDSEDVSRYSVIDGQQRLTAILRYFKNQFPLRELDVLGELNGSFYRDLPPFLVRRLEERTIRCLRIDSTVDAQVKYDIFERLNSGSVKLEAQELRNAVSRGPFNDLIKELSKNEDFRVMLQIDPRDPDASKKVQKMEDIELVLRFFALSTGNYASLKKGFKQFLTDEMNRFNKLSQPELQVFANSFVELMKFIRENFGDRAFAKYRYEDGGYRLMSNFNAAVYDALAVGLSTALDLDDPMLPADHVKVYKSLFKEAAFFNSVEGSVNDREKIITRIEAVRNVFQQ